MLPRPNPRPAEFGFSHRLSPVTLAAALLGGCLQTGDPPGGPIGTGGEGSGGQPEGGSAGVGDGTKGAACQTAADCVEPEARCREGGVCTGTIDAQAFQN